MIVCVRIGKEEVWCKAMGGVQAETDKGRRDLERAG